MNQRDQNQGGRRGGRGHPDEGGEQGRGFADERDHDPRSWRERLAAQFRDPHRPEPQWLREDRERAGGHGREWGESQREARYQAGMDQDRMDDDRMDQHRIEQQRMDQRRMEHDRLDQDRMDQRRMARERIDREDEYNRQRARDEHDLSTGWEPARWSGDDYFSGQRQYGGFRVGTSEGLGGATGDYARPSFGGSYGNASGYGGESRWGSRSGYEVGAHQRDVSRSFRGLGPASYQRPDERIRDDVYERLTDSHIIDAREILVEVHQGNVTLSGTVHERRMRYAAEDLVANVMGVANINNQLKVEREGPPPTTLGRGDVPTGDPSDKHH